MLQTATNRVTYDGCTLGIEAANNFYGTLIVPGVLICLLVLHCEVSMYGCNAEK